MKQLKFNPDEDMKELAKFGFGYTYGEDWHRYFDNISVSRGDNNEFVIDLNDGDYWETEIEQLLLLEYDLIKANLLIVESDEDVL